MSDRITDSKREIVDQAQALADTKLSGESRSTNVVFWDDGDFKVEVIHGTERNCREKILWRSNKSGLYPAKQFLYIEEEVVQPEGTQIHTREQL